ncbi:hypothetical protein [Streptomyces sp. NPDC102487]|uniref:hypothetical protein n=1 Tax=Streptomyces sp. NPDC102487 TaxID=3366182 RepID=UPI003806D85F
MSERETREEVCPDCLAGEHDKDARIITAHKDPESGNYYTSVTWHTNSCPAWTVDQILMEEGIRKSKEKTAWMKVALPAALERLKAAAVAVEPDESAAPFVAALLAVVEQQASDVGVFVTPERLTEILDEHFPPRGETPEA